MAPDGSAPNWDAIVAAYLRDHPAVPRDQDGAPKPLEVLLRDPVLDRWFVRFPVGMTRWVTTQWLLTRGFPVPPQPILGTITGE